MDDINELEQEFRAALLRVSIRALQVVEEGLKKNDTELAMKLLSVVQPAEIFEDLVEEEEDLLWEEDEEDEEEDEEDEEDEG